MAPVYGITSAYLREGASVVVTDRIDSVLAESVQELEKLGNVVGVLPTLASVLMPSEP